MPEYHGPTTLAEALGAADRSKNGIALAESVPDGSFVAVEVRGVVRVRRSARRSGHAGSEVGTGEWLQADDVPPTVLWRGL